MLKDFYQIFKVMHVDILVIMAHPDDAELSCSGTILSSLDQGLTVGMIDLTAGELGTRGTSKLRLVEADNSAKLLKVSFRENMFFRDGYFTSNDKNINDLILKIRKFTPNIIITNSKTERHPDHEEAAKLVKKASFLSGLKKIKSKYNDNNQESWRPKMILNSIQNNYVKPDFIVDISKYYSKKIDSIMCFKSQFYNKESKEPESFISSKRFINFISSRAIEYGHMINVEYGEGFVTDTGVKVNNLSDII